MTRILIVDDQPMYRIGLAAILGAQDDLTIVGEAGDGQEAIARSRSLQPDVVLMDVRMPNLNGIEATRAIAAAANDGGHPTRVVMLTTFDIDDYVFDALRAGASGFLLKDATPQELVDAVRTVAGGDALLAPKVTRTLIEAFAQAPAKRSVSPPASTTSPNANVRSSNSSRRATPTRRSRRLSSSPSRPRSRT